MINLIETEDKLQDYTEEAKEIREELSIIIDNFRDNLKILKESGENNNGRSL